MLVRLAPAQYPLLLSHLLQLSDDDRYLRFRHAASDESIEKWVNSVDSAKDEVVAFFARSETGSKVVAAAVLQLFAAPIASIAVAELSLTVDRAFRGAGIGKQLTSAALKLAQSAQIGQVRFDVSSRNTAARRLLLKFSPSHLDDETLALEFTQAQAVDSLQFATGPALACGEARLPVALCIHGAGGSAWQYHRGAFSVLIQAGYRPVAIDISALTTVGFNHEATPTPLPFLASLVARGMSHSPAVVLGHSLGAVIATAVADELEVARLVLLNPMPLDGMSAREQLRSASALSCSRARAILKAHSGFQANATKRRNVAVLHGTRDAVSNLDFAQRSARRCVSSHSGSIIHSDGGHIGMRDTESLRRALCLVA